MSARDKASERLFYALSGINDEFIQEAIDSEDYCPGKSSYKRVLTIKSIPKILLVAALVAIPASAIGDSSLMDVVKSKMGEVDVTNEQLQEMTAEYGRQHVTVSIMRKLPELKRNSDGLVYGFDSPVTDLVTTLTDNREQGYSYRNELYATGNETPEEKEYKKTHTRKLPVYKKDGKTLIGYFTCGWFWEGEQ